MERGFIFRLSRARTARLTIAAWGNVMRENGVPRWSPVALLLLLHALYVVARRGGLVLAVDCKSGG